MPAIGVSLAVLAFIAFLIFCIDKVATGHGQNTYSLSGFVEWTYAGYLIFVGVAAAALAAAAIGRLFLWVRDWLELRTSRRP